VVDKRLEEILEALQDIAAGDLGRRLELSAARDELDAIGHAINVVGGELEFTTERLKRARDEAERTSDAKTVFLRNVSHDLRTPLAAILGMAQLLQVPGLDEGQRRQLCERIVANVHIQAGLLDELIDLSQVESGELAIEMLPIPAREVLGEVVTGLEATALRKGLALDLEPSDAAPAELLVLADRRRLRQILENVLGNAIKFTTQGRIVARAAREERDVAIDVVDTGIGIERSNVARIFEPFSQAEPSIGARFGGSGLGLALTRGLARRMGGDLALIATEPGVGTTFRLRLPAWQGGAPRGDVPVAALLAEHRALDELSILVVDDQDDIRTSLAALLRLRGASVVEAASGSEAIQRVQQARPDVILMDVRMPGIGGLEATRRLRAMGFGAPIVAVTADVSAAGGQGYQSAGFSAQMVKPIDVERLIVTIRGLLAG
jgi:signal transduction histidine kinase